MSRSVTVGLLALALAGATVVAGGEPARPRLEVADAACGCPGVAGVFVALLHPERGMLLLSARAFPGGEQGVVTADGRLSHGGWAVDRVAGGAAWAARYPFLGEPGSGCVAFDREHFSAEGDLVSYLRWVAEKVYLQLPAAERERWPAFTLADRRVTLRVEQEGFRPLPLAGREGSTIGFRLARREDRCFLLPFVLEEATGRLAIRVGLTEKEAWSPNEAEWREWVVASPGETVELSGLGVRVTVEGPSGAR